MKSKSIRSFKSAAILLGMVTVSAFTDAQPSELDPCTKRIDDQGSYYTGPTTCPSSCGLWSLCPKGDSCGTGTAYASCGPSQDSAEYCQFFEGGTCQLSGGFYRCVPDTSTHTPTFPPGQEPPPVTVKRYDWPVPCGGEQ